MQYKDGRIVLPIVEFSISGNTYNVNGINLSYAVFFVKKDRKKFVLLQPAEYAIQTVGANVNLVIQDSILNDVTAIQVALDISKISSDYNVFGTPDITILKDRYNQLEKDMSNLWEYIKKQGVTSDVMNVDVVIPSLSEGETYIMRNGSIEATPLISAEDELQKLLEKLIENSQGVLDGYVELLKNDIENQTKIFFEENKKEFLNKTEIRKEINYVTGTEYKETNIFGIDLKSIVAGETYYNSTKPYMAIKTDYNSNGFLAPDTENFIDITNKNLNEEISELKGSYYAPIKSLVGTFPTNGWVNWVAHDSMATHVMIVLEVVGVGIGSYPVPLKVLRWGVDYHYHIECSSKWFAIRNHNGIIQVSCPSNGTEFQVVKLVEAFFYK